MKNLIFALVLFASGVIFAKFYFTVNTVEKTEAIVEEEEVIEDTSLEEVPGTNTEEEQNKPTVKKQNKVKKAGIDDSIDSQPATDEKAVSNEKISEIDKKLKALDDKINKDIKGLKGYDKDFAQQLEAEINDKSKIKMDGDDEFTAKEYE